MIVRWRLDELPDALAELGIVRPFVVAGPRWRGLDLPAHAGWWDEVPSARIEAPAEADGLLAIGGGSAIDTAKAASARTGLPVVSVPTTYSGAEWSSGFGIRTPDRRMVGGGGGAHVAGIVYDVELTLGLPVPETVGTSLNALAHCAEALYVRRRSPEADEQALAGAALVATALPAVVDRPDDRGARLALLQGAAHAGHALGLAGLGLAHAMAQAVGGAYGIPHGAANALCLPPALRFNRTVVPDEIARLGDAVGGDPVERAAALARRGGFDRLRDLGVPREGLDAVAEAAAGRRGNLDNPRVATAAEIRDLFESIW
ncbi:MAG TPA: iron-containing alcohol dehydrogenase [Gaiellaceae bacterium]|nr:iron-containing alcohol dehydrogenase [Gaiellaceae bacterium]